MKDPFLPPQVPVRSDIQDVAHRQCWQNLGSVSLLEHAANSPGLAGTADESATALASCSADIGDHRSSVVLIAPTMEIGIGGYLWLLLRDDLMRQKPYHNPQDEGEPIYRCERGRDPEPVTLEETVWRFHSARIPRRECVLGHPAKSRIPSATVGLNVFRPRITSEIPSCSDLDHGKRTTQGLTTRRRHGSPFGANRGAHTSFREPSSLRWCNSSYDVIRSISPPRTMSPVLGR